MAKKPKQGETRSIDNFELDGELDFNFGGDIGDTESSGKGRNPVVTASKAAIKQTKDIVLSRDQLSRMMRESMPKEFGKTIELAGTAKETLRDLYNDSMRDLRPLTQDLRRTAGRALPLLEGKVPDKLFRKLEEMSRTDENSSGRSASERREGDIQAGLGEVFKLQEATRSAQNKREDVREQIRENIAQIRHRDQYTQLDETRKSLATLAQYKTTIESKYQQKTLELSYRQYFAMADLLSEFKKHSASQEVKMKDLVRNTGLPDFVKMQGTESVQEILRNRFIGSLSDGLLGDRGGIVKRLGASARKVVGGHVSAFSSAMQMGAMAGDAMVDQASQMNDPMMAEMTGGKAGMAGTILGGEIGAKLGKSINGVVSPELQAFLKKHPKFMRMGNRAAMIGNDPYAWLKDWANSSGRDIFGDKNKDDDPDVLDESLRGRAKSGIKQGKKGIAAFFKDIVKDATREDTALGGYNFADENKPAVFSNRNSRSLNEVIPGYLSHILRELQIIRTGDEGVSLVKYDAIAGKFGSEGSLARSAISYALPNKKERRGFRKDTYDDMAKFLPANMSPKKKLALSRLMLEMNASGAAPTADRLRSADTYRKNKSTARHADEFAQHFDQMLGGADGVSKHREFAMGYSGLGKDMKSVMAKIQDLVNAGYGEYLEQIGVIKNGNVNVSRVAKLAASGAIPGFTGNDKTATGVQKFGMGDVKLDVPVNVNVSANTQITNQANGPKRYLYRPGYRGAQGQGGQPNVDELRGAMQEAMTASLQSIGGSPDAAKFQAFSKPVTEAIGKASSKGEAKSILDVVTQMLTHMQALEEQGKVGLSLMQLQQRAEGFFDGIKMPDLGNVSFKDMRLKDMAAWVKNKGKEGYGKIRGRAGEARDYVKDHWEGWKDAGKERLTAGKDFAMNKIDQAKDRMQGFTDVYVRGEDKPRLTRAKLKAGFYIDQESKKVIRSWKDIKGTIVDREGEVILDITDIDNIYTKNTVVGGAVNLIKKGLAAGKDGLQKAMVMGGGIYGMGLVMAGKALKLGFEMTDAPYDVYVKGEEKPRLLKVVFGTSQYFDETTLDEIMHPRDIRGPVVNQQMQFLITDDDLKSGLVDVKGRPILSGRFSLGKKVFRKAAAIGSSLKGMLKGMKDKMMEKVSAVGSWLHDLFKLDGPLVVTSHRMTDILERIHDMLDDRLPGKKVSGDSDGDGVREGSYKDYLRKKKERDAAAANKDGKRGGPSTGLNVMGGLSSLMSKFGKKKEGEEEKEEEGGSMLEDAANLKSLFEGSGDGIKRNAGRLKRGAGKLISKGVDLASRYVPKALPFAGLGMGGAAAAGGATAAGTAAAGAAASGAGLAAAGTGAAAAGTAAAGVGTAAAAGGGVLAAIGGFLTSPALLVAVAVAGTAYLGYKGYRKFIYGKMDEMEKIRYVQYGFAPDDSSHIGDIKDLESELENGVYFVNGRSAIDVRRVDVKKVLGIFGVDEKETPALFKRFVQWYANRFFPIFMIHRTVIEGLKKGSTLSEVSKLTTPEKLKYIEGVRYPDGPYEIVDSPFEDLDKLPSTATAVRTYIDEVKASFTKDADKAKNGAPSGRAAALGVTAAAGATAVSKLDKSKTSTATAVNQLGLKDRYTGMNSKGMAGMAGTITVTSSAYDVTTSFDGRVDALSAVRFKTYGLREMDAERVKALAKLEKYVQTKVGMDSGNKAIWKGDPDEALQKFGTAFLVDTASATAGIYWKEWFAKRFLPTYLNYVSAIRAQTGKTDPDLVAGQLSAKQAMAIGMAVFATEGVWQVKFSPWSGYQINVDSSTVEPNLNALKDAAKTSMLADEKSSAKMSDAEKRKAAEMAGGVGPDGKPKSGTPSLMERATTAVKDMATGAWDGIKDAGGWLADKASELTGIGGDARAIQHPGKGTGGDVNAIPLNKGDNTWAAHKDTILAASKMAGVDPRMMASMAAIESGFRGTVKAPTGSATGLYQFIGGTWDMMLKKYGPKYGIAPGTPPTDTRANALMGAEYIKDNIRFLKKTKPQLTDTDLYMAHFLGPGGARGFLRALQADPNILGNKAVSPEQAASNKNVFFNKGQPRTVGEIYQMYTNRLRDSVKKHKIDMPDGSEAIKPSAAPSKSPATPGGAPAAKPPLVPIANQNPVAATTAKTVPQSPSAPARRTTPPPGSVAPSPSAKPAGAIVATQQQRAAQAQQLETFNSMDKGIGGVSGVMNETLLEQRKQTGLLSDVVLRLDKLIGLGGGNARMGSSSRTAETPKPVVSMNR